MSTQPQETPNPATPLPGGSPLPAIAAELQSLLDRIEALIPNYKPYDVKTNRAVTSAARFGHELIAPTITAVTSFPPLAWRNLFDVARAEEALLFRDSLRPVLLRMSAIAAGFRFTLDDTVAAAATEALETYQWAKRRAKRSDAIALRPYLDEMQRVVRKVMNVRQTKSAPKPLPGGGSPVPPAAQSLMATRNDSNVTAADPNDDLPPIFRQVIKEEEEAQTKDMT
jgi:hypothetical protein